MCADIPKVSIQKVLKEYGSHLAHYVAAKRELAACADVDEAIKIVDRAGLLRTYAAQVQDFELENLAKRIRLRAEKRAGELLIEMKAGGKLTKPGGDQKSKSRTVILIPKNTLADLGVTPNQSSQWQKIAEVPKKRFEEIVESDAPSRAAVLKEAPARKSKPKTKAPKRFNVDGFVGEVVAELGRWLKKIPDDHSVETRKELKEMLLVWLKNL